MNMNFIFILRYILTLFHIFEIIHSNMKHVPTVARERKNAIVLKIFNITSNILSNFVQAYSEW
jgi:hypothetical protein